MISGVCSIMCVVMDEEWRTVKIGLELVSFVSTCTAFQIFLAVFDNREELRDGDGEAGCGVGGGAVPVDSGNGKGKRLLVVWSIRSSDNKLWVVCGMLAGDEGWEAL